MATTAVFAEILIVGLQVEAWLLLLLFNIFGREWIDIDEFRRWESLVTFLVLATAYVLGILIDRVADSLLGWSEREIDRAEKADSLLGRMFKTKTGCRVKSFVFGAAKPPDEAEKRLVVMSKGEGIARFLEYQRSRLRIARATLLNLTIALPNVVVFLSIRAGQPSDRVLAAGTLIVAALPLTLFVHGRIQRAFRNRLEDAYVIVSRQT